MNARQLKARYTLATALLRNICSRPFVRHAGAKPWLAKLREEQLGVVPQDAWSRFAGASRCIACGLCDAQGRTDTSAASLVMGAARQPADAPLELEKATVLHALAADIARVCPARIAAEDIAALIHSNAMVLADKL